MTLLSSLALLFIIVAFVRRNIFWVIPAMLLICVIVYSPSGEKQVPEMKADLPEEVREAKVGDLLVVEKTTCDSIYLGFARNKTEYKIELIDQFKARVNNGVEVRIISVDSIQSYIINDNL